MAIAYHPRPGQILMCDFSEGFKVPEIVKKRPVVVLSPSLKGRTGLVTVGVLSSTPPDPPQDYHYRLPKRCLPQLSKFQKDETWLKGDMIYTVSFERLSGIVLRRDYGTGKRVYFTNRLSRDTMKNVYCSVLDGLNLGHIAMHL